MNTENNFEQLPDGITMNAGHSEHLELDSQQEVINTSKCGSCSLTFESVLITTNSRHEGSIRIAGGNKTVWKNSLPKDRTRCIKLLDESLKSKLDTHKESHNND